METTPIEVLEHHVEMLSNKYEQTEIENYQYRRLLLDQIFIFIKAILELKNIELKIYNYEKEKQDKCF
jgi:hypothetical protein